MAFGWDDAAAAGLKYGPALVAAFSKGGQDQIDWNQLQSFSNSLTPEGYVTPTDIAASAATKERLGKSATAKAGEQAAMVRRRAEQRGTGTSPALETSLARVGQNEAAANERAGETAEQQLYNAFLGNKRFAQQKDLTLLGAKVGDLGYARNQANARYSTWMNSLMGLSQAALDHFSGGAPDRSGMEYKSQSDSTYNPREDPSLGSFAPAGSMP